MPARFQLFCGAIRVGEIQDAFLSDDTWFGRYKLTIRREEGGSQGRILDFIELCGAWNRRIARSPSDPPETSEFDRFSDLITPNPWSVLSDDGNRLSVEGAPNFLDAGEMSWRLSD